MKKHNVIPPMVRVFLSSTFADMQNERQYYNNVLAPQMAEICKSHGVSFFSIDLRWGVTKEEQLHGQALSVCLNEIDKCRPFFIGLLGNAACRKFKTVLYIRMPE